jgi:hypothetical protein
MQYLTALVLIAQGVGMLLIVGAFIPAKGKAADKNFAFPTFGLAVHRPLLFGCGVLMVGAGYLFQGITGLAKAI